MCICVHKPALCQQVIRVLCCPSFTRCVHDKAANVVNDVKVQFKAIHFTISVIETMDCSGRRTNAPKSSPCEERELL